MALLALHQLIITQDTSVTPIVKPLMGKDAIHYEQGGYMKYGLAIGKQSISLHCLPIYMDKVLHAKYTGSFGEGKVQKGCINFSDELPFEVIKSLIAECSTVDIAEVLNNRKKKK